jgi:hypothetical protein
MTTSTRFTEERVKVAGTQLAVLSKQWDAHTVLHGVEGFEDGSQHDALAEQATVYAPRIRYGQTPVPTGWKPS